VKGVVELATDAETTAGTDNTRAVTPAGLKAAVPAATDAVAGRVELATQAEVNTGTDATRVVTPATLAGSTAQRVISNLNLPGSPTTSTQDVSDWSTKVATTAYVRNQGYVAANISVDAVGATTWARWAGSGTTAAGETRGGAVLQRCFANNTGVIDQTTTTLPGTWRLMSAAMSQGSFGIWRRSA